MYTSYFGFRQKPFNVTPDPRFFYTNPVYQEAYANLLYGIRKCKGFMMLIGEVGQDHLDSSAPGRDQRRPYPQRFNFDLIRSPKDFLRCLCQEFGLTSPVEKQNDTQNYLALLNRFLLECYRKGDNVALVIDEAQNLSAEVLERVRLLSSFETNQENCCRF